MYTLPAYAWAKVTIVSCQCLPFLGYPTFLFKVRFAVLKVLKELYTKWGEEFLVLLPETIPFLAELMEGNV